MRRSILPIAALVASCACAQSATANIVTFNFDTLSINTPTTFTDSVGAVTATFSSPSDPGAFKIVNHISAFLTLQLHDLEIVPGFLGAELDVHFSQLVDAVTFNFGSGSATAVSYQLRLGGISGTIVAAGAVSGTIPSGKSNYEGIIQYSGGSFDTVRIGAPGGVAIDNLSADAFGVPEPGGIMALGVLVVGVARRRRQNRAV